MRDVDDQNTQCVSASNGTCAVYLKPLAVIIMNLSQTDMKHALEELLRRVKMHDVTQRLALDLWALKGNAFDTGQ